jgi:cytochrome c peroxidase
VLRVVFPLLVVVLGCGRSSKPPPAEGFADERAALATQSPLPAAPLDPTNAVAGDPRAAALGQMLFFDVDLAGPLLVDSERGKTGELRKLSCRSCHGGPALDDPGKHVSLGAKPGTRNSPPVLNSVFYTWTNWGGRFDSQWALTLGAIEKPDVMNGTRLAVVHVIRTQYRPEYEALFGPLDPAVARMPPIGKPGTPAWEGMNEADRLIANRVFVNAGKAIAAYMRLLVARDAPFDRWVAGDENAISTAAKRGARIHIKHCKVCHDGPHFTDNKFHALAVAQFGEGVPQVDLGRFSDVPDYLASPFNAAGAFSDAKRGVDGLTQLPVQRGQFRTPTLRNVAVTAPFMHAGQFATLDAVVKFYNVGGGAVGEITKSAELRRLELTAEQQVDLVAFMETLTATDVLPERLSDTSR